MIEHQRLLSTLPYPASSSRIKENDFLLTFNQNEYRPGRILLRAVSGIYKMSFEKLGLSPELLGTVTAKGYTDPTPIQAEAIPAILSGRDIFAAARTGTGKTAAFALPLLQILSENPSLKKYRKPRALILVPTRELAAQVGASLQAYGRRLALRSAVIYGGVTINPQIERLRRGVDIVIATPGRLLDHALNYTINLSFIEYLVLDEADRMLDMGFIHDIREILDYLPLDRQNLMFSATFSASIRQLAETILDKPFHIEVSPKNTAAEGVTHYIHPVERSRKRELLSDLIHDGKWKQVLVFTRTKHGADRLTIQLAKSGIKSSAIHSDKTQTIRNRTFSDFKNGKIRVLVATDLAARGLDIDSLPHVVNFDLPTVPEDYLHRIGRTGRAGQNGVAISLVCRDEQDALVKIEKLLKKKLIVKKMPGFQYEVSAKTFAKKSTKNQAGKKRRPESGKQQARKKGWNSKSSGRRSRKRR